jgi:SAM-dependent methyltransferase
MHMNSLLAYTKHARLYVRGVVLEVGPEDPSLLRDVTSNWTRWHTADIRTDRPLTYPGCAEYSIPVADGHYDAVVSANVLEHVREPWTWMKELLRVTRPGGHVVVVTPANWCFHEDPIDCWRVWPDGLVALFRWAGLEPILALAVELDPGMPGSIDTVGVGRRPPC